MRARQGIVLTKGLPSRVGRGNKRPGRQRHALQCRAAVGSGSAVTMVKYAVRPGDTLWDISRAHKVSVSEIREANSLTVNDSTLSCGQVLLIPHTAAQSQGNVVPGPHLGAKDVSEGIWSSIASKLSSFEMPKFQQSAGHGASAAVEKDGALPAATESTQPSVTASKGPQVAPGCSTGSGMSPSQRRNCPDLWTYPSSKVQSMTVDDCEQVLYDNLAGGLDKDLMLVVYAPWCPYCKDIEASVEKLATGLQRDDGVTIAKLRGDSAASRLWLRAQLGVDTFPAIVGFPQDGGGPLRYVGPRDTLSLLEFMNVHCRALNIGAKPLRLENTKSVSVGPPQPVSMGATSTNSGVLAGLLLVGIVSAVAIAVQALKRPKQPAVVEKIKKTDPPAPADDVKELDQSIMQLLAVLGELVSLRIEVILRRLSHTFTRILRFVSLNPSKPPTPPADSAPGSSPPAQNRPPSDNADTSRPRAASNGSGQPITSTASPGTSQPPSANGAGPGSPAASPTTTSSAVSQTVQASRAPVEVGHSNREIGVSVSGQRAAEMSAQLREQQTSSLLSSYRNETVQRNGLNITTLYSARDHPTA